MKKFIVYLLVIAMLMAPMQTYASDITIDVPPPAPARVVKEWPKYTKCVVNGKRQACYGLSDIKSLYKMYKRMQVLELYPKPLKKAIGIIKDQREVIRKKTRAIELHKKANKNLRIANGLLKKKIALDARRAKWARIRNILILSGVTVVAIGVGFGVGYGIAQLTR